MIAAGREKKSADLGNIKELRGTGAIVSSRWGSFAYVAFSR